MEKNDEKQQEAELLANSLMKLYLASGLCNICNAKRRKGHKTQINERRFLKNGN